MESGKSHSIRGGEHKDISKEISSAVEGVEHAARDVKEKSCKWANEKCNQRKYVCLAMLLGAFLLGAVGSTLISSGGSFVARHWDRESWDAHHALDVVLDHIKHPESYRGSSAGVATKAKNQVMRLVDAVLPTGWSSKLHDIDEDGSSMWGEGGGRKITDLYESAKNKARRTADQVSDSSSSTLSGWGDRVKGWVSGGRDEDEDMGRKYSRGGGGGGGRRRSSDDDEDEEYRASKSKMSKLSRGEL